MISIETVLHYHERTKHHFNRYARSLWFMDWENQPDPFRRFIGTRMLRLPRPAADETPPYPTIYGARDPAPVRAGIESISSFLYHSMALSAWKQYLENRWSLRVNPSSGNLHPTEGYLGLPALVGASETAGIYHYAPGEHGLELRTALSPRIWRNLLTPACEGSFLVGLTSVHWRESWKYGERAFRYCQLDLGHALSALRLSAAMFGWRLEVLDHLPDSTLAQLLGTDRQSDFDPHEAESPEMIALVCTRGKPAMSPSLSTGIVEQIAAGAWFGRASRLSRDHHSWEVIEQVAAASRRHKSMPPRKAPPVETSAARFREPTYHEGAGTETDVPSAGLLIRRRRSAVEMDGTTSMPAGRFFMLLERLVPESTRSPWDAWPLYPRVHLGLFVHRINGLAPGLYFLARTPDVLPLMRRTSKPHFNWTRPETCPKRLPLYRLEDGNVCTLAAGLSCHQSIAGEGAFSATMLAEFEAPLRADGAHIYRRLFWEAGMIGQVLYLEAEAAGMSGTGIGCFFDDPVHHAFGLEDRTFQAVYHFAVGGALKDPRVTTEPAYPLAEDA